MDFLVGSGNHVKSDLTFVASSVPLIENSMTINSLTQSDQEKVLLNQVFTCGDYILINYCKIPKSDDQETKEENKV